MTYMLPDIKYIVRYNDRTICKIYTTSSQVFHFRINQLLFNKAIKSICTYLIYQLQVPKKKKRIKNTFKYLYLTICVASCLCTAK